MGLKFINTLISGKKPWTNIAQYATCSSQRLDAILGSDLHDNDRCLFEFTEIHLKCCDPKGMLRAGFSYSELAMIRANFVYN